jgi:hypothetical protein
MPDIMYNFRLEMTNFMRVKKQKHTFQEHTFKFSRDKSNVDNKKNIIHKQKKIFQKLLMIEKLQKKLCKQDENISEVSEEDSDEFVFEKASSVNGKKDGYVTLVHNSGVKLFQYWRKGTLVDTLQICTNKKFDMNDIMSYEISNIDTFSENERELLTCNIGEYRIFPITTSCDHKFCKIQFEKHTNSNTCSKCPLCRAKIKYFYRSVGDKETMELLKTCEFKVNNQLINYSLFKKCYEFAFKWYHTTKLKIPWEYYDSDNTDSDDTDSNDTDSNDTDSNDTDSDDTDSNHTDSNDTDSNDTDSNDTDSNDTDSNDTDSNDTDSDYQYDGNYVIDELDRLGSIIDNKHEKFTNQLVQINEQLTKKIDDMTTLLNTIVTFGYNFYNEHMSTVAKRSNLSQKKKNHLRFKKRY